MYTDDTQQLVEHLRLYLFPDIFSYKFVVDSVKVCDLELHNIEYYHSIIKYISKMYVVFHWIN